MSTEEERRKRREYMRIWRAKNIDKVNSERKAQDRFRAKNDPKFRVDANRRNAEYYDKHKDVILSRAKDRNWNYDPIKRKAGRMRVYYKNPAKYTLSGKKGYAKKKGIPYDLTEDWYNEQFAKGCAMTGLPLDFGREKTPWAAHIDRIVPEDGYVMSNCRLVCACYNLAKYRYRDEDVIRMATHLILRTRTSDT